MTSLRAHGGQRLSGGIPVDWTLDDVPHYAHKRDLGYRMPITSPQRGMEVFRSELGAA